MTQDREITIISQREIDFQGDEITAVIAADSTVYIPVRPLCDALGVDWSAQYRRIKRDVILSEVSMSVAVTATDVAEGDSRPKTSTMVALPLDYLNGWLFGINPERVKDEIRERVILYQKECYRVLAAAFRDEMIATQTPDDPGTALARDESIRSLVHIKEMALAIAHMAAEQIEHEQRISSVEERLNAAALFVRDMQNRLVSLEKRVSPGGRISDEQAGEVAASVKALAYELTQKDSSKNHYQSIWNEIYRRFRVSKYAMIRQADFPTVLAFLEEWLHVVQSGEIPNKQKQLPPEIPKDPETPF